MDNKYFIQLSSGQIIFGKTYTFLARVASQLVAEGIEQTAPTISEVSTFWQADC